MNGVWWFCAKNKWGDQSRVAHILRNGEALCGTNAFDATHSVQGPEELGAQPCKRCTAGYKAQGLYPTLEPRDIKLYRLGGGKLKDRMYIVCIDGRCYEFDYYLFCAIGNIRPHNECVGERRLIVKDDHLSEIEGVEVHIGAGWQPIGG